MIAICSMVRKPLNFETWLKYHFSIGVEYIFLRIEETPELKEITDRYPNKIFAEYISETDTLNNYYTIQERQTIFIDQCIQSCLGYGIRWLFHIDSDELIWCKQSLISILTPISKSFSCIHFQNYEAVYDRDDLPNPFLNTNQFIRCKDGKCLSYANGKSVGRVTQELRSYGPHYFTGRVYELSDKIAAILHFDSPTFQEWYNKFSNLSNISVDNLNKIPFKFYRESIDIIQKGNMQQAREYYNIHKTKLSKKDGLITIPF